MWSSSMLKLISTKELNIELNCVNGFRKILKLSFFNKFFTFFGYSAHLYI